MLIYAIVFSIVFLSVFIWSIIVLIKARKLYFIIACIWGIFVFGITVAQLLVYIDYFPFYKGINEITQDILEEHHGIEKFYYEAQKLLDSDKDYGSVCNLSCTKTQKNVLSYCMPLSRDFHDDIATVYSA